MLAHKLFLNY